MSTAAGRALAAAEPVGHCGAPSGLGDSRAKVVKMTMPSGEAVCFSRCARVSLVTMLRQSSDRGVPLSTAPSAARRRRGQGLPPPLPAARRQSPVACASAAVLQKAASSRRAAGSRPMRGVPLGRSEN